MEAPNAAAVRTLLPPTLNLGGYGYPAPLAPEDADPLEHHVTVAAALAPGLTGYQLANVPAEKEPIFGLVIAGLALRSALDLTPDRLETLADFDLLSSFSAGSYSETRRDPEKALQAQAMGLTGWPGLDWLILQAMSPDKRDEYLAMVDENASQPAWAVGEVNWGAYGVPDDWLGSSWAGLP